MTSYKSNRIFITSLLSALIVLLAGCGKKSTDTAQTPQETQSKPAAGVPIPTEGAKITGTIKFAGDIPQLREIDMSDEPVCAGWWEESGEVARSEALVLGADNGLANVFVSIKSGLSAVEYIAPSEPVIVDQVGCRYIPHVFAMIKGQPVIFKNSDGVLHNVHALPNANREFNLAMPGSLTESKPRTFKKVESMFTIKCDKHPWMNSYAAVLDHPFFGVTGKDGAFEIVGLPAGTYEVEAWHEKMGTQVAQVTVGEMEIGNIDFTFSR